MSKVEVLRSYKAIAFIDGKISAGSAGLKPRKYVILDVSLKRTVFLSNIATTVRGVSNKIKG
ncbi:MAG: hypothetical protein QXX34_03235 [Candidatus Bathyarchaeia archaeon]